MPLGRTRSATRDLLNCAQPSAPTAAAADVSDHLLLDYARTWTLPEPPLGWPDAAEWADMAVHRRSDWRDVH